MPPSVRAGACAILLLSASATGAPPAAGRGYGVPLRTVNGLDDVRAALVDDDGTVTAALGPGGVVRVRRDGSRETVVPWWPAGGVAEAVALARAPDGRLAVVDRMRGAVAFVAPDGSRTSVPLPAVGGSPCRPVGIAFHGDRMLLADAGEPRVVACRADGGDAQAWPVPRPVSAGLPPILGGIAAGGGAVLVTDVANNRVVALSAADGSVRASAGDRGPHQGMWQSPAGAAWDGLAFVVTDLLNHRVVRVDAEGRVLDQWGQHAVRPREGNGKIHYPTFTGISPDGATVAVAEPFERRVQLFGGAAPPDPAAPRLTPLPAFDGVASHFSTSLAVDGRTLAVFEPESASALVFDLRAEPPIHVTTIGGPGNAPGRFGQVTALCVDEPRNRIHLVDPVRMVIASYALVRDGTAPHFDPFMPRLVSEVPLGGVSKYLRQRGIAGPERIWPVDLRRTPDGTFVLLDQLGPRLVELDAGMRPVAAAGGWEGDGRLALPTQLAVGHGGELMVVDAADRSVKRYARSDGAFLGSWKVDGARRPFGIAGIPDAGGAVGRLRFAVSDAGADELTVLDLNEGKASARGGENGSAPGELWEPAALQWSPVDGRIYVTDHGNHRIQTFDAGCAWLSSFGIGRAWVRPKDPQAKGPVSPAGRLPPAEGAADTRNQFPPAAADDDGWWRSRSADGRWSVAWRFDGGTPPLRDPFGIDVRIAPATDGPVFAGTLSVDAAMPHHGHGMNVRPTVRAAGDGAFRVDGMLFHMPGYWELYLDALDGGRLERTQGSVTLE